MSCAVCAVCVQGKQGSDDVQVPAELLLAAQQELKGKAQMAKDLEMVRAQQGGMKLSQPCWGVVPTNSPVCLLLHVCPPVLTHHIKSRRHGMRPA